MEIINKILEFLWPGNKKTNIAIGNRAADGGTIIVGNNNTVNNSKTETKNDLTYENGNYFRPSTGANASDFKDL